MANHKRRRPKHQRAGCLWCKPHKHEAESGSMAAQPFDVQRELQESPDEIWDEELDARQRHLAQSNDGLLG
jgi:hypothetical protein